MVCVYTAGRYATTAAVDQRFKLAAGIMLGQLWTRQQAMGSELTGEPGYVQGATFAIPNSVKELLADQMQYAAG